MSTEPSLTRRESVFTMVLLAPFWVLERTRGWRRLGVLGLYLLEGRDKIDRWSLGRLKEAVALPLFPREMGCPPATPAEALRRYLPLPGDSPARDEAEPVREGAGDERRGLR